MKWRREGRGAENRGSLKGEMETVGRMGTKMREEMGESERKGS